MPGLQLHRVYKNAEVDNDTILFRITTPSYSGTRTLLSGKGSNAGAGRYHRIQQPTAYVSDNVLLCITEKLYHRSYEALRKLANNSLGEFQRIASSTETLVVFSCTKIPDLVNIDSSEALQAYQLNPSTITHPDQIYYPLQDAADKMRGSYRGIVSASARHSRGHTIALFLDHTKYIQRMEATLAITLSLVSEDLKDLASDSTFDPLVSRISFVAGYFSIDANDFSTYGHLLNPQLPQRQGYVSLTRIYYPMGSTAIPYPKCAIR